MACLTQTWTNVFSEQVSYIDELLSELQEVDFSNQTITLYQNTEPSSSDLTNAWQAFSGVTDLPPVGVEFQWYSPTTGVIENIYFVADDVAQGVSTSTIYGNHAKDRTLDWIYLDEVYSLDDVAVASMAISGIPQTHTNMIITHSLRALDAAATVSLGFRVNGLSGATWGTQRKVADGAAAAASAVVLQTGILEAAALVAATTALAQSFTTGYIIIPNYSETSDLFFIGIFGRKVAYNGATPFAAGSRDSFVDWGSDSVANTSLPVTSISFTGPATTFRRGSKIAIYLLK